MTKSADRLAWFDGLTRPLTEPEQEEYWRALHALYMREWRAARLEAELNAATLAKDAEENKRLLRRVSRQLSKPVPDPEAEILRGDKWVKDARKASDMLLDAIQRAAA